MARTHPTAGEECHQFLLSGRPAVFLPDVQQLPPRHSCAAAREWEGTEKGFLRPPRAPRPKA